VWEQATQQFKRLVGWELYYLSDQLGTGVEKGWCREHVFAPIVVCNASCAAVCV
jgi:hypothetical protein